MAEPVRYIPFGGAQVPECTKRKVIDRNGQKIYCVWTDDNGSKITYPEQHTVPTNITVYEKTNYYPYGFSDILSDFNPETHYISKNEFEDLCNNTYFNHTSSYTDKDGFTYIWGKTTNTNFGGIKVTDGAFSCRRLNTTPTIDTSISRKGIIYDTLDITLSNMEGATVTGSTDEDKITLMNSSNCTVDVSNANNNMFVSDNVKVINGEGNKVKAGDHDKVTFRTYNYETATGTIQAHHKGEGTYKQ